MQQDEELLFPWIEKQIASLLKKKSLEKKDLVNLGIGDTCHPLPSVVQAALHQCVDRMAKSPIGYGAEQGRAELRQKVAAAIYPEQMFTKEEVFITEGIANSLSLLLDLFSDGEKIGVLSPTYPVYKSLLQATRKRIYEIPATENLSFTPPEENLSAVILCSPNNPTGIGFSAELLQKWVDWAVETNTLILFDGAYESFIFDASTPRSIYEIEGAKKVAIEMRSFSKSMGFSALRLGYFIVPRDILLNNKNITQTCNTLITAKTNGVSYLIQEAGLAALSDAGLATMQELSEGYMEVTKKLKDHLVAQKQRVEGGTHAPYLFLKVDGSSKEHFAKLLNDHHTITVPGIGFGKDGYLRLSGFLNQETLEKACKVLQF